MKTQKCYDRRAMLIFLLSLFLAFSSVSVAETVFDSPVAYPGGTSAVVLVDVNNDGNLDMIRKSYWPQDLVTMLNDGSGVFTEFARIAAPQDSRKLYAADFNGDEAVDILAFSEPSLLFLNIGNGSFQSGRIVNLDYPTEIALGDLNEDGAAEIVLSRMGVLETMLNDGSGSFSSDTLISIPSYTFFSIRIGEVTGDDHVDIVCGRYGSVRVYPGDGAGNFGSAITSTLPNQAVEVELNDMDNDSDLDLCLISSDADVRVYSNNGLGSFAPFSSIALSIAYPVCYYSDFDADLDIDLIVGASGALRFLANNGTGNLNPVDTLQTLTSSDESLIPADLDKNGLTDLVVATCCTNEWDFFSYVCWNHGNWNFAIGDERIQLPYAPNDLETADINSDGILDLVSANLGWDNIGVAYGQGDGSFLTTVTYPAGVRTQFVATGNLNDDDVVDVVATSRDDHGLFMFINDGVGNLELLSTIYPTRSPKDALIRDLDQDRDADVLVNYHGSDPHYGFFVYRNDGPSLGFTPIDIELPLGAGGFVVDDLDNDGGLEIAVSVGGENEDCRVLVFKRDSIAYFTKSAEYQVGEIPLDLVAADFNKDGFLDLATANYFAPHVSVLIGDGNGSYAAAESYDVLFKPEHIFSADYNLDGNSDLLVGSTVLLGYGTGEFAVGTNYWAVSQRAVAQGDVDLDGDVDFVAGQPFYQLLSLARNLSHNGIVCGDMDGNYVISISDVVYFVNYLFSNGPVPISQTGDVNCDNSVNLSDAVYGLNFIFAGGPTPCAACK